MGRLVYSGIGSLDGFIADPDGDFVWSAPGPEVHAYINRRERGVTTALYGRRLYEVMKVWETFGTTPDAIEVEREFGEIWRSQDKIVFSSTLSSVGSDRTRLERVFDPAEVRRLVDATEGGVSIGGPDLAAHALRAGIVDGLEYYANPVVLGAGKHWLPGDLRLALRLTQEHRFDDGVVHLAYEVDR